MNMSSVPTNQSTPSIISSDPGSPSMLLNENGLVVEQTTDGEWYDPNEPRYCICNQVSYGDMVACDNDSVSIGFSVYVCVCVDFRILNTKTDIIKLTYALNVSFLYSVHSNGSITHALASRSHQKENGIVRNVHQRSKNEEYANECTYATILFASFIW